MFHYLYILRSEKYNKFYIGFTSRKLNIRLEEHNNGKVSFTSRYLPWKLVYFEGYLTEAHARNRERMLKQYGSAWQKLKKRFMGKDSWNERAGFARKLAKGEKCMEVFDLESKATVLSDP